MSAALALNALEDSPRATGPLRVLFIEDNAWDVDLMILELTKAGYEVSADIAQSEPELRSLLGARQFDIVLADYRLPGWTGLEAVSVLRELGIELPLILVTGTLGDELAVECLKRGVWDYVLKDKLVRLPFAVRRALCEKTLHDQRAAAAGERERLLHQTQERMKELTCLYQVISAVQRGSSLEQIIEEVVALLPAAMQYPERAGARIRFDGFTAASHGFEEAGPCGCVAKLSKCESRGEVAVCYRHADGETQPPEFLAEEVALVESVARALSEAAEHLSAEKALLHNEARFRALTEQSHDLVTILDASGVITYQSPSVRRVLGYEPEEMIRRAAADFVHPHDREFPIHLLREGITAPGQVGEAVYRCQHKDGSWRVLHAVGTNLLHDPAIQGIVVNARDITVRERAERIQAALYRIATEAASSTDLPQLYRSIHRIIGEFMYARNFYIALYDPAAETLSFDYMRDEIDGDDPQPPPVMPAGHGLSAYVMRTGQALFATPEVFADLVAKGEVELIGAPCVDWLGIPLKVGERTLGVLAMQSYDEHHRYTEADRDLLTFVSQQVAIAIAHKRDEEARRRSELKYRELFDSANIAILIFDPQSEVILEANRHACRVYDFERQELVGKSLKDLTLDVARGEEQLRELLKTGSCENFETVHRRRDGTHLAMLVSSRVIEYEGRQAVLSVNRDVSALKEAEDKLRRSELQYRHLFESANDSVLIFEPETETILEANPAACAMYGLDRGQIIGSSLKKLSSDVERGEKRIETLLAAGRDRNFETTHRRADGSEIHLLANSAVVEFLGRRAVLANYRDITELKRAQEQLQSAHDELERRVEERTAELLRANNQLKEEEERYRMLMEEAGDAILLIGGDLRIILGNACVCTLLGYAPEELVNKPLFEIVEHSAAQRADIQRRLDLGETARIEDRYRRKDGSLVPVEVSVRKVGDRFYQSIARDITERKQVEMIKDEVVSTVSHELRTPLASLRGFAELMLMREFPPEKQREFLGIIHKESRRLEELINNFLDLQRIESGKQIYQFEALDLAATLRESVELFRAGSDHAFRLELAEDLPRVRADTDRIRQVISNLIANAVKYSPDGGTITVSARGRERYVEVTIADEGIGIPHEVLPRLFGKFFRADNAVSRGIAGTGLGLALVKQILENHGGRVWVECPAKGSVFHFTLSAADATECVTAVAVAR